MEQVSIIGVDLANKVFQLPGATAYGAVLFSKKLSCCKRWLRTVWVSA